MLREVKLQGAIMELLMQRRLANLADPNIQAQEMARLEAHRESFIAMKLLRLHHPELTNALRNEREGHLTVLQSQLGSVNQSLQSVLMHYHRFEKHHVALQGLKETVDTVHHKAQMLEVIMNDKIGQQHVAEVAPGCQQIIRS